MKKAINLFVLIVSLAILGCSSNKKSEYNFTCGTALTSEELTPFESPTTPAYDPNALKLLGKLSLAIFDSNNRIKSYNVQFFENSRQRLAVQVYGIWEPAEMDHAACAVFNFKDYILPPETVVIFYRNEKKEPKTHIVAGVRKP